MLKVNLKNVPFDLTTAAVAAVVALCLIAQSVWTGGEKVEQPDTQPSIPFSPIEWVVVRPDPEPLARPHFDWAAEQCLAEVEPPLDEVRSLIADARRRVPDFVAEARGLESKFHLVSGMFQGNDEHTAFLRSKFETLVLSEHALQSALERSLAQYKRAILSTEGELILRLRTDIADPAGGPLALPADGGELIPSLDGVVGQSSEAIEADLGGTIVRELCSFIVTSLLERTAAQLFMAVGVLNPNEERDWGQFTVEFVTGWLVDQFVIQPAYEAMFDPSGKLTNQIVTQLNEIEQTLIEGDDTHFGWKSRLTEYARQRAAWREDVLLGLLRNQNGGAK